MKNNRPIRWERRRFMGTLAMLAVPVVLPGTRARAAEPTIVETANGRLRGLRDNGVLVFKGIPYAADTSGRNRFMAPRPVVNWAGVREALEFGNRCPQARSNESSAAEDAGGAPAYGEDCCVVNVWTPDINPHAHRPVMLYVHGGGFRSGAGDGASINGANLAKFGDVVVLTLNHRLNVFGYSNLGHLHPDFADAANAGQLDLVAALKWVRTNIRAFGGDPERVTIFGESGGGAKIVALSMMPAANGLFQRSINMSGSGAYALKPAAETEELTNEWLRVLGINRGELRRLQEVSAEQLLSAHTRARANLRADELRPVVEGRHILHAPMSPEGVARQAALPGILSRTVNEASLWLASDRRNLEVTEAQLSARLQAQFAVDAARAKSVMEHYREDDPTRAPWDVLLAVASDALVRTPIRRAAEARSRVGAAPAYLCDFAWRSPVDGGIWGGAHAIDIPFAFGNLDKHRLTAGVGDGAIDASRSLMSAYVAFATTGSPNNRRTPHWVAYDTTKRPSMVVNESCHLVEDYRAGDRRGGELLPEQSTFQLTAGPLFRVDA